MPVPPGTTKARKPSALKLIAGTLKAEEQNPLEPDAEQGAPDAPEHLDEMQRAAWDHFAEQLRSLGVLYRVDGAALEALACTYAQWLTLHNALREQARKAAATLDGLDGGLTYTTVTESGSVMRRAKPEVQLLKELTVQLRDWLGRFGLTPADRGRVSAAKGKDGNGSGNPDDEFAG